MELKKQMVVYIPFVENILSVRDGTTTAGIKELRGVYVLTEDEMLGLITEQKWEYKSEWQLSEKAHDLTLGQLVETQEERNKWKELCEKLLREMDAAEWQSPIQEEARGLLNH